MTAERPLLLSTFGSKSDGLTTPALDLLQEAIKAATKTIDSTKDRSEGKAEK